MKRSITYPYALLVVLALVLAQFACASSTTPQPAVSSLEAATSSSATEPSTTSTDLCQNQYLPVVNGATYSSRGTSSLGESTQTAMVTDVQADSFSIEKKGTLPSGRTYTVVEKWSCTDEGLVQFLSDDLAGVYTGSTGTATAKALSNEGVTIPDPITEGDDWSQTITADVTGKTGTKTWTVTYEFTALGEEQVTVAAGIFTAMKVHQHVNSSTGGQTVVDVDLDFWFSPGVGTVKSDFGYGGDVLSTSELLSYNIP